MFDLNITKLLFLAVIALVVFGPERLPGMAAQAGKAVRQMRTMLDGAKSELQENLGPEFSQFDIADLNPKHFVRKHLVEELTGDGVILGKDGLRLNGSSGNGASSAASTVVTSTSTAALPATRLAPGELPPFDMDAT